MFHIILNEPEIPPNTGNVIRLCANTGARLHLIEPLGFGLDEKSLRRSGLDYHDLADITVHASFADCAAQIGLERIYAIETSGASRYCDASCRSGDAFVFGSETRGLPRALLDRIAPERRLHIPMRDGNRSINLSNCVALVVYEAWRQTGFAV
jgi:tRNA (cytidine/uridine-2'-O-)-methyltransferase